MALAEQMKLGKLPKRHDPRTIQLSDYIPAGAPPIPPATKFWEKRLGYWGVLANERLGNCVLASAGHQTMLWTAYSGSEFIPSEDQIIADYSAITGYDPAQTDANGNNPTDNGTVMLDALNYRRKIGILGRRIEGYAALDPQNTAQVCQAIYLFVGIDSGLDFPQSAMDQFFAGKAWDVVRHDGGIQGGHCVYVCGYDADGVYCITWGKVQFITWAFWKKYFVEAYSVLSPYVLDVKGLTPAGYGVDVLRNALGLLAHRKVI